MMESRVIDWMRCWLFRDWCCGAAHSSERSQPLPLEIEHPSASHQLTWLILTYLTTVVIMKCAIQTEAAKAFTVKDLHWGETTIVREAGALGTRTQDWYQWHEPNDAFVRFPNAGLCFPMWMAMPDWSHSLSVTLYVTQLVLKECGHLK